MTTTATTVTANTDLAVGMTVTKTTHFHGVDVARTYELLAELDALVLDVGTFRRFTCRLSTNVGPDVDGATALFLTTETSEVLS